MAQYANFIPENTALKGSRRIGIYNTAGNRVGQFPLGNLSVSNKGVRLYSFGVMADPHLGETDNKATAEKREAIFKQALKQLGNNQDILFICICGDLVYSAVSAPTDTTQWEIYKGAIDSSANGKEVFAIAGNHDRHNGTALTKKYTGHDACYSFTHGDDVFIMLGCFGYLQTAEATHQRQIYGAETLQWIYDTLEANRNKRCFVMQHVQPVGELEEVDIFQAIASGGSSHIPLSVMQHYRNAVVFHGHTHAKFATQTKTNKGANYNEKFDFRSVHVPSLGDYFEGYIVDVHKNGIHLQGFNFDTEKFVPIASYWIETPLVNVAGDSYTPEV